VRTGPAAERIDRYLSRLVAHGFAGAVLVAQAPPGRPWQTEGRVVLKRAYGLADRENDVPYTVDMVSTIGSVTKQFTGAAIVKLEMMGRLSASDPIARHLAGVPADKAGITIHHLLTHTAGFAGDLGGRDDDPIDRDALVARVLAAPLASAPGERFEYSNEGYALAGAIVERVSGQGYEAFLHEHLFLPAGMPDTGYQIPAWPEARLPVGYLPDGGRWGRVAGRGWRPDGPGWYLRANGGLHSTLDDLYRWHVALASNAVLSDEAKSRYQTGHVPSFGEERYAYGWGVRPSRRGGTVLTHNGGNGIFSADFRRYVDEGVVIIAMSNQPVIPAVELAPRQLEALYFDDAPAVMPPEAIAVPRAEREGLAGIYVTDAGTHLIVRATSEGLEVEADDPTIFGVAGALSAPGGRFRELETRTVALLEAASQDDFRPVFEAFNFEDGRPFEQVQANQQRIWAGWRETFGAFQRVELLGTGTFQGDPAVTVRMRFERGGPVLQYLWGPRRLFGMRRLEAEVVALTAESPRTWILYRYRLPRLIRVQFGDGTIEVDGPSAVTKGRRHLPGPRRRGGTTPR
jgi:CubicO group peptidase (beta-lactamase class C family)